MGSRQTQLPAATAAQHCAPGLHWRAPALAFKGPNGSGNMAERLVIQRVRDLDDPDILTLVAKSDAYLSALYPPESNHAEPLQALIGADSAFFAGYANGQLAACGAVKRVGADISYGEIKRVFVDEAQRGKGFAIAIMRHLEAHLSGIGIELARLEAGPLQPEALALYEKLGYALRGPFGDYQPDPLSVFMEKRLTRADS